MINDSIKVTGALDVKVFDANGNVKHDFHVKNTVMDVGKIFIASRMAGTSSAVMSHMAIGTDNTSASANTDDTTLGAETSLMTRSAVTTTPSGATIQYVAEFGTHTGVDIPVAEAGIFNASTGGVMLCRTNFGVITKTADDTMTITWTITIA